MSEVKLSLRPDLQMELGYVAQETDIDTSTLLEQAVRDYLDRLAEKKIIAESKAFQLLHTELLLRYQGEYVAVHNGEVVDHDTDLCVLNRRIRTRYGRTAVLLQRVTEQPKVEWLIRSPKLETVLL